MKKLLLSIAAVVALSATASAQTPGTQPIVASSGAGCNNCGAAPVAAPMPAYGYGYAPAPTKHSFLGRLFTRNRPVNTLPVATGGQLAFPQNPFVRSPRDFFMYD
jgi:hypothetical protein